MKGGNSGYNRGANNNSSSRSNNSNNKRMDQEGELGASGGIATLNDLNILDQALTRLFEASIHLEDDALKYLLSSLGALSVSTLMDDGIRSSQREFHGNSSGSGMSTDRAGGTEWLVTARMAGNRAQG